MVDTWSVAGLGHGGKRGLYWAGGEGSLAARGGSRDQEPRADAPVAGATTDGAGLDALDAMDEAGWVRAWRGACMSALAREGGRVLGPRTPARDRRHVVGGAAVVRGGVPRQGGSWVLTA